MNGSEAIGRPTWVRHAMLSLIAVGTLINYLDRTVLGIAAARIPGGTYLDRYGTRLTHALSIGSWSLFTLLHVPVGRLAGLFGLRLLLGGRKAPASRPTAGWS